MYYSNWNELKEFCPIKDGRWDQEILYEYLVSSCYTNFKEPLDNFFGTHQNDEALAELLFDFLLNDEYDGSESQIGAAYYISKLDKIVLKRKKKTRLFGKDHLGYTNSKK